MIILWEWDANTGLGLFGSEATSGTCPNWVEGKQYQKSSHSSDIREAKKLRDQILGRNARGDIGSVSTEQVTCGQLLDDFLDHSKANAKSSTAKIWRLVIDANLRPFFATSRPAGSQQRN